MGLRRGFLPTRSLQYHRRTRDALSPGRAAHISSMECSYLEPCPSMWGDTGGWRASPQPWAMRRVRTWKQRSALGTMTAPGCNITRRRAAALTRALLSKKKKTRMQRPTFAGKPFLYRLRFFLQRSPLKRLECPYHAPGVPQAAASCGVGELCE